MYLTRLVRCAIRTPCRPMASRKNVIQNNILPNFQCFSTNSSLSFKMFMEHENVYAYNVMKNNGYNIVSIDAAKESSTLSKEQFDKLLSQDWSNEQSEVLFRLFPKFGAYATAHNMCISNKMFDAYIDHLTDSLAGASDGQLVSVFYSLYQWPETESVRTRNFIEVWAALDETCFQRLHKWSFDELLTFLSLFYMLNVSKGSDYFRKSLDKLAAKAKKLTPNQLVQTLFFVGIQRRQPYDMHNLEVHLENNFEQFHVDELAIMAMGFFKSKTPLRNIELVKKIINKVTNNAKNINEVTLAALLKIVRYSLKVPEEESLQALYIMLDTLNDEIPRLSILCNVHIALVGTSKLVFHEKSLNSIAKVVYNNMSDTRVKDLERLALSYGTFVYTPQVGGDLFDKIIDELRSPKRETEINDHGRSFACCVSYLTLLNKYPEDLINKVLNEEFLLQTYGNLYMIGKETLALDNIAEMYLKDKGINRLPVRLLKALSKKYTDYVPSEEYKKQYNITDRMMLDMSSVLTEMRGGSQFHKADHILTHHQRGGTSIPIVAYPLIKLGLNHPSFIFKKLWV